MLLNPVQVKGHQMVQYYILVYVLMNLLYGFRQSGNACVRNTVAWYTLPKAFCRRALALNSSTCNVISYNTAMQYDILKF